MRKHMYVRYDDTDTHMAIASVVLFTDVKPMLNTEHSQIDD